MDWIWLLRFLLTIFLKFKLSVKFIITGEPTPYGWPSASSHFGAIDFAGFPKDFYYYY